jgi:hypothetical protein
MKSFKLLTIILLGHLACFGQFEKTPIGFYKMPDIGNWDKILIIESDSTYYFLTDTDRGLDIIEPNGPQKPNWTFDKLTNKISLKGTDSYKPSKNQFLIDESSNLTDLENKTWTKFADFDLVGNLKTYKDNSFFIQYSSKYQPTYSEEHNIREQTTKRSVYYKLDDIELNKFTNEFITSYLNQITNSYDKVIFINGQIRDFFPVESNEITSKNKKKINFYEKDGQLKKKR